MKLLKPEEIAREFRVNRTTVYDWIQSGKLSALKAGGTYRITPESLRGFLVESGSTGADAEATLNRFTKASNAG